MPLGAAFFMPQADTMTNADQLVIIKLKRINY
jgi:hypothetical protein